MNEEKATTESQKRVGDTLIKVRNLYRKDTHLHKLIRKTHKMEKCKSQYY